MKKKPAMCIKFPEMICPGGETATIECNSITTLWQGCWTLAEYCERKAKRSRIFRWFKNPFRKLKPLTDEEVEEEWRSRVTPLMKKLKKENRPPEKQN